MQKAINRRTYQVTIKTQYHPAENIYVEANSAKQAISDTRRKARFEGWFDRRIDGRVTYSATANLRQS